MAERDASNSKEIAPPLLRGVGKWGTPELPEFDEPGDYNDDCAKYKIFINHFCRRGAWGFVIFRTVYTPESDQQFASALARIEGHIRLGLSKEPVVPDNRHPAERLLLVDIIMSHFQNAIFDDKDLFDQAAVEDVSPYFRLWLAEVGRNPNGYLNYAYNNFIIIDEEGLRTIAAAPDSIPAGRRTIRPEATVQLIQAQSKRAKREGTMYLWSEYHNGSDDHF